MNLVIALATSALRDDLYRLLSILPPLNSRCFDEVDLSHLAG